MNMVQYKIIDGDLPIGISLDTDTGRFNGVATSENIGLGPSFTGPVSNDLGAYDEGDEVSFGPITVDVAEGLTASLGLTGSGTGMPWGLVLDPDTGMISGTLAELLEVQKIQSNQTEGPIWSTQFGKLGAYDEGDPVEIQLAATPRDNKTLTSYALSSGGLPWGLVLDSATGLISGTTADLKAPGLTVEVPSLPLPTWNDPIGTIGVVNEFQDFTYTLSATPAAGRQMVKYVIREGGTPWGLSLDETTGVISGTTAELRNYGEAAYYEGGKDPQISDTVVIQGTDTQVDNQGSLGTYAKGDTVSIQFAFTPYAGRTIDRSCIIQGVLPWGLSMDGGIISGTVDMVQAVAGQYTITLKAIDSAQAWSVRTYNIVVEEAQ